MAIENNYLINQICVKSGLSGQALIDLRTRLSSLSRAELEAELVKALTSQRSNRLKGIAIEREGIQHDIGEFKAGIKDTQISSEYKELFEVFDENHDGKLDSNEISTIENIFSISAGEDNVLDSSENRTVHNIFTKNLGVKSADFMGFVEELSKAEAVEETSTNTQSAENSNINTEKWSPIYKEIISSPTQEKTIVKKDENTLLQYENGQLVKTLSIDENNNLIIKEYKQYELNGEHYCVISRYDSSGITIIKVKATDENGDYKQEDVRSISSYDGNVNLIRNAEYDEIGKITKIEEYENGELFCTKEYVYTGNEVIKTEKRDDYVQKMVAESVDKDGNLTKIKEIRTRHNDGRGTVVFCGETENEVLSLSKIDENFEYNEADITDKKINPAYVDTFKEDIVGQELHKVLAYMLEVAQGKKRGNLQYNKEVIKNFLSSLGNGNAEYEKISDNPETYAIKYMEDGVEHKTSLIYVSLVNRIDYGTTVRASDSKEFTLAVSVAGDDVAKFYKFNANGEFIGVDITNKKEPNKSHLLHQDGTIDVIEYENNKQVREIKYNQEGKAVCVKDYVWSEEEKDKLDAVSYLYTEESSRAELRNKQLVRTQNGEIYYYQVDKEGNRTFEKKTVCDSIPILDKDNKIVGYNPVAELTVDATGKVVNHPRVYNLTHLPKMKEIGDYYDFSEIDNELRETALDVIIQGYDNAIEMLKNRSDSQSVFDLSHWLDELADAWDGGTDSYIEALTKKRDEIKALKDRFVHDVKYDENGKITEESAEALRKQYADDKAEFERVFKKYTGRDFDNAAREKFLGCNQNVKKLNFDLQRIYDEYKETHTLSENSKILFGNYTGGQYNEDVFQQFIQQAEASKKIITVKTKDENGEEKEEQKEVVNVMQSSAAGYAVTQIWQRNLSGLKKTETEIKSAFTNLNNIDSVGMCLDIASICLEFGLIAKGVQYVGKGLSWGGKLLKSGKMLRITETAGEFLSSEGKLATVARYALNASKSSLNLSANLGIYGAFDELGHQINSGNYEGSRIWQSSATGMKIGALSGLVTGLVSPQIMKLYKPESEEIEQAVNDMLAKKSGDVAGKELVETICKAQVVPTLSRTGGLAAIAADFLTNVAIFTGTTSFVTLYDDKEIKDTLKSYKMSNPLLSKYTDAEIDNMSKTELMSAILNMQGINTDGLSEIELYEKYFANEYLNQFKGLGQLKIADYVIGSFIAKLKPGMNIKVGPRVKALGYEYENGKYYRKGDKGRQEVTVEEMIAEAKIAMSMDILDARLKNRFNKYSKEPMSGREFLKLIYGDKNQDSAEFEIADKIKIEIDGKKYKVTINGEIKEVDKIEDILDIYQECVFEVKYKDIRDKAQKDWEARQQGNRRVDKPTSEELEYARNMLGFAAGTEITKEEVKKKIRELSLKYHPDRNKGDKEAEAKFKEISRAKEIFSRYFESIDAKSEPLEQVSESTVAPENDITEKQNKLAEELSSKHVILNGRSMDEKMYKDAEIKQMVSLADTPEKIELLKELASVTNTFNNKRNSLKSAKFSASEIIKLLENVETPAQQNFVWYLINETKAADRENRVPKVDIYTIINDVKLATTQERAEILKAIYELNTVIPDTNLVSRVVTLPQKVIEAIEKTGKYELGMQLIPLLGLTSTDSEGTKVISFQEWYFEKLLDAVNTPEDVEAMKYIAENFDMAEHSNITALLPHYKKLKSVTDPKLKELINLQIFNVTNPYNNTFNACLDLVTYDSVGYEGITDYSKRLIQPSYLAHEQDKYNFEAEYKRISSMPESEAKQAEMKKFNYLVKSSLLKMLNFNREYFDYLNEKFLKNVVPDEFKPAIEELKNSAGKDVQLSLQGAIASNSENPDLLELSASNLNKYMSFTPEQKALVEKYKDIFLQDNHWLNGGSTIGEFTTEDIANFEKRNLADKVKHLTYKDLLSAVRMSDANWDRLQNSGFMSYLDISSSNKEFPVKIPFEVLSFIVENCTDADIEKIRERKLLEMKSTAFDCLDSEMILNLARLTEPQWNYVKEDLNLFDGNTLNLGDMSWAWDDLFTTIDTSHQRIDAITQAVGNIDAVKNVIESLKSCGCESGPAVAEIGQLYGSMTADEVLSHPMDWTKGFDNVEKIKQAVLKKPDMYVNGEYETEEMLNSAVETFFKENKLKLAELSLFADKEFLDNLMRRRFNDVKDYLKQLKSFTITDFELLRDMSSGVNIDGKPFMPTQKVEMIDLIGVYKINNLDMSKMHQMIAAGKIDLTELKIDLFNQVMKNSGLSEAEIASIPKEKLILWDTKYIHLMAKQLEEAKEEDDFALQDIIRAANLDDFNRYIQDKDNRYGLTNEITRADYEQHNMNYERWLKPSQSNEVHFVHKDMNAEKLEQIASQLEEDIETLRQNKGIKGLIDKQFSQCINKDGKFFVPDEYLSSKAKLKSFVEYINGQLQTVWDRAEGNKNNPQRAEQAARTLTIKDHISQRLNDISTVDDGKVEKTLDITIKMWDRVPQKDLFQGNYSTCCIGMDGGNGRAMSYYLLNTTFNMIELIDNKSGKVIGNALCYFTKDADENPVFIIDNIEINNSEKPSDATGKLLRDAIAEYADNVAQEVTGRNDIKIYMSSCYNDVPHEDLQEKTTQQTVMGDITFDEIYLDAFSEPAEWTDRDNLTQNIKLRELKSSTPLEHKYPTVEQKVTTDSQPQAEPVAQVQPEVQSVPVAEARTKEAILEDISRARTPDELSRLRAELNTMPKSTQKSELVRAFNVRLQELKAAQKESTVQKTANPTQEAVPAIRSVNDIRADLKNASSREDFAKLRDEIKVMPASSEKSELMLDFNEKLRQYNKKDNNSNANANDYLAQIEQLSTQEEVEIFRQRIISEKLPKDLFGPLNIRSLQLQLKEKVSDEDEYNRILRTCRKGDGSIDQGKLKKAIKDATQGPDLKKYQQELKEMVPDKKEYEKLTSKCKTPKNYKQVINYVRLSREIKKNTNSYENIAHYQEIVKSIDITMEHKQELQNMLNESTKVLKLNELRKNVPDSTEWNSIIIKCTDENGNISIAKVEEEVVVQIFSRLVKRTQTKQELKNLEQDVENTPMTSANRSMLKSIISERNMELFDDADANGITYNTSVFDAIREHLYPGLYSDNRFINLNSRHSGDTNYIHEQMEHFNYELKDKAPNIIAVGETSLRGKNIVTLPQEVIDQASQLGLKYVIDLRYDAGNIKVDLKGVQYYHFPTSFDDLNDKEFIEALDGFMKIMNEGNYFIGCANGMHRTDLAIAMHYAFNTECKEIPSLQFIKRRDVSGPIQRIYTKIMNMTKEEQETFGLTEETLKNMPKSLEELNTRIRSITD